MKAALELGTAIRASREARSMSQVELARIVGVSRPALRLLEVGGGTAVTLNKVAQAAPVTVSRLRPGNTIAERLTATRSEKGWSVADLATRTGLAPATVRAVERGGGSIRAVCSMLAALSPRATFRPALPEATQGRTFATILGTINPDRHPSDHYATPIPIIRVLLDHEVFPLDSAILEPAVGEHRVIERALQERGYRNVTCRDINAQGEEQQDFLQETKQHDVVITNPPFRLHLAFITHAKKIARTKIVLLLPVNLLTGAERLEKVWRDTDFPLTRVHVLSRGVDFRAGAPLRSTFTTSPMYLGWFVFERGHTGPPSINWIDNGPWVEKSARRSENSSAS